ncbi:MAG: response regulator [Bacteroidales bacterium]|nr:response regulator [Bacteroidales bacterium]
MERNIGIYKILVVEDSVTDAKLLTNILERAGYSPLHISNGNEALKIIKKENFDLILLDIMMPEMDGFDVCRAIKHDSKTKDIPIIFTSGKGDKESIVQGFEMGAVDYITKPYYRTELLSRIRTHLDIKNSKESMRMEFENLVVERTSELEKLNEILKNEIKDRRKAEKELRKLNRKLLFHIHDTPLAYVEFNIDMQIIDWNPAATKIFGYHENEAFMKVAVDFLFPEDEIAQFTEVWNNLIFQRGGKRNITTCITKSNNSIFCIWYNTPLTNNEGEVIGVASLIQDITERKHAEQELILREKQYRLLFDNMTNGFMLMEMILDKDNEIIDFYYLQMNRALQKIIGEDYSPFKYLGKTLKEAPINFSVKWYEKYIKVALQGDLFRIEDYSKELDMYYEMLLYQPQYGQVATIINDITERKKAERKINQQFHAIRQQHDILAKQTEKLRLANAEIKKQKDIIEEKNMHITDSIRYAQNIQKAILTDINSIKKSLPNIFIYFKPLDLVSGDFYWYSDRHEKKIIAAVDCTGHGVPGGYMSMIGNDLLNSVINLQGITSPDEILLKLHHSFRESMRLVDEDIYDGMDAAICCIDEVNKTLEYAGAKNPLIYIQDNELYRIAGDPYSVGVLKLEEDFRFVKHTISLNKVTTFYIFSDGYQDQFGGSEPRKFYPKNLQKLFLENYNKPMEEQKQILSVVMNNWMKNYEQIDDMLIIGVRI